MLFPLTSLCVIACIAWAYRRDGGRSPLVLALSAWALSLFLALPIFFKYSVAYSVQTDAFAAACLSAVSLVYLFFRWEPRVAPSTYVHRAQEIRIAIVLGVAGAFGCLLLLADAHAHNGLQFSISYLVDNLSNIRADSRYRLAFGDNRGFLGTVGGLIAPCAVLCVLAAVKLGREAGRAVRLLGAINLALVAAVSFMVFAGRATFVNLVLIALISVFVGGRRLSFRPRTVVVGVLLVTGAWFLSTALIGTREKDPSVNGILTDTMRAELRPWLAGVADSNKSVGLASVSVAYFSATMPTLHFYTQNKAVPGPFYGAYSFPLPARLVGTINGTWDREQWYDTREKIYAPITSRGYFGNVWATWLRDLIVDFGYFGAIIFCGVFGAFLAWARNRYELTGALHYHYLTVIPCFTFGFGAFTSFVFDSFVSIAFFVALAIMVIVRVRFSVAPRSRVATAG